MQHTSPLPQPQVHCEVACSLLIKYAKVVVTTLLPISASCMYGVLWQSGRCYARQCHDMLAVFFAVSAVYKRRCLPGEPRGLTSWTCTPENLSFYYLFCYTEQTQMLRCDDTVSRKHSMTKVQSATHGNWTTTDKSIRCPANASACSLRKQQPRHTIDSLSVTSHRQCNQPTYANMCHAANTSYPI